jgi:hypothetical protein
MTEHLGALLLWLTHAVGLDPDRAVETAVVLVFCALEDARPEPQDPPEAAPAAAPAA